MEQEETQETPEPIEVIAPPKRKHMGETTGGDITIFRLRHMTQEEIERYSLEKYARHLKNHNPR